MLRGQKFAQGQILANNLAKYQLYFISTIILHILCKLLLNISIYAKVLILCPINLRSEKLSHLAKTQPPMGQFDRNIAWNISRLLQYYLSIDNEKSRVWYFYPILIGKWEWPQTRNPMSLVPHAKTP